MQIFSCVSNSSFSDVCINTYGSMDNYIKLLVDNGLEPNEVPYSGQQVQWDNLLVSNQSIQSLTASNNIVYATLFGANNQNNIPMPQQYSDTRNVSYTASADGENNITITELQGNQIVQIEREVKPLLNTEFSFNSATGVITLTNGLANGETLFVIYKVLVNY